MRHDWTNYCLRHIEEGRASPWVRRNWRRLLGDRWETFAQANDLPVTDPEEAVVRVAYINTPPRPGNGFGTELKKLLSYLGVHSLPGCGCANYAAQMNLMSTEDVQAKRDQIISWLRSGYNSRSWVEVIKAGGKGVLIIPPTTILKGIDAVFNWLLDEAIRKALEKERNIEGKTS